MDLQSHSSSPFTETKNAKSDNTRFSDTAIAVIIDGDALLACSDVFRQVRELLLSGRHERSAATCMADQFPISFSATKAIPSAGEQRAAAAHSSHAFLQSYLNQIHQEIALVSVRTARKGKCKCGSSSKEVACDDDIIIYRYVFTDLFLNSLVLLSENEGLPAQSERGGVSISSEDINVEDIIVECMKNIPHCQITVLRSRPPNSIATRSRRSAIPSFLTLAVPKNISGGASEGIQQHEQLAILCSPVCGSSAVPSAMAALSVKHLQQTDANANYSVGKNERLSVILVSPDSCFGEGEGEEPSQSGKGAEGNMIQSFLQEALASRVWSIIEAVRIATSTTAPAPHHHNGAERTSSTSTCGSSSGVGNHSIPAEVLEANIIRVVGIIPMIANTSLTNKEKTGDDSSLFSDYVRIPSSFPFTAPPTSLLSLREVQQRQQRGGGGAAATTINTVPAAIGSTTSSGSGHGGLTESDLDALFEDFTVKKKSTIIANKKGETDGGPLPMGHHGTPQQTKGNAPNAKNEALLNTLGIPNSDEYHTTFSSPLSNSISNHYSGTTVAGNSSGAGRRPASTNEGGDQPDDVEFVKTLFSRRMRSEKALKRRLHAIYLKIVEREIATTTVAAAVAATAMSPSDLKKKHPIANFDILLSCCAPNSSAAPPSSQATSAAGGGGGALFVTTFATLLPLLNPPTAPASTFIGDNKRPPHLFAAQVFYDGVSYKRHYFASVSPSLTAGGAASTSWEHPLGTFFTQHLESQSSKFLERRLDSRQPQDAAQQQPQQKYYHLLALLAAFVKPEDVSRYAREEAKRRLRWSERTRNSQKALLNTNNNKAGEVAKLTFSNEEDTIKFAKTLEDSIRSELLDLVQLSTTSEEGSIFHSLLLLASEELSALLKEKEEKTSLDLHSGRSGRSLLADDEEFRSLFENGLTNTEVSSMKETDYFDQPRNKKRRIAMYFPNIDLADSASASENKNSSPPLRLSHVGNDLFLLFLQECRRVAVLEEAMHPLRSWAAVVDEEEEKGDEGEEYTSISSRSTLAPVNSANILLARETEEGARLTRLNVENSTQIGMQKLSESGSALRHGENLHEAESKGTVHRQQNIHEPQPQPQPQPQPHQRSMYEDPFSFDGVNDLIGPSSEAPLKSKESRKKKFEAAAIVADLFDGEDDGHNNTTRAIGGGLLGLNDEKRGLLSENNFFGVVTPGAGGSQGASLSGSLPSYIGGGCSRSSFSRPLPQPKVADLLQNTTPKPAAWTPMNTSSSTSTSTIRAAEEHNNAKTITTTNSTTGSVNGIPTISVFGSDLSALPSPANAIQLNNGNMPTLTAAKPDGGVPPRRTTTTTTTTDTGIASPETGKMREGNYLPQNDENSSHTARDQFRELKIVSHNGNQNNINNANGERSTISEHFAIRKPLASGHGSGAIVVPQGPVLSVHTNSSSSNSQNKMAAIESNPSKNENSVNPTHFANNGIRLSANMYGISNSVPAAPVSTTPASPLTPASPTQADVDRIRALLPDGYDCQLVVKEGKPNRIVYIDHKYKSTSWAPPAGMR